MTVGGGELSSETAAGAVEAPGDERGRTVQYARDLGRPQILPTGEKQQLSVGR